MVYRYMSADNLTDGDIAFYGPLLGEKMLRVLALSGDALSRRDFLAAGRLSQENYKELTGSYSPPGGLFSDPSGPNYVYGAELKASCSSAGGYVIAVMSEKNCGAGSAAVGDYSLSEMSKYFSQNEINSVLMLLPNAADAAASGIIKDRAANVLIAKALALKTAYYNLSGRGINTVFRRFEVISGGKILSVFPGFSFSLFSPADEKDIFLAVIEEKD